MLMPSATLSTMFPEMTGRPLSQLGAPELLDRAAKPALKVMVGAETS